VATPEENREGMTEAMKNVKTGQVTYAVRDTMIDDREIHQGDIMGLGDHSALLAVGSTPQEAVLEMLAKLRNGGVIE
jgi:dihydroxyacetone kinase-like predicted kinase